MKWFIDDFIVQELSENLILKEQEMLKSSDKRYEEERIKRERLESENMLLRRDMNKCDIRFKALQRFVISSLSFLKIRN